MVKIVGMDIVIGISLLGILLLGISLLGYRYWDIVIRDSMLLLGYHY